MERTVGRLLYPRGPGKDYFSYEENKRRQNISDRTALKRAGYKRHPKSLSQIKFKKGNHTFSDYHYTRVIIYSDLSDYVTRILKVKTPIQGGVTPTWKRSLHAKRVKRKVGGDRTERKVYNLTVRSKQDITAVGVSLMALGRSFHREIFIGCPETMKIYDVKPGYLLTSRPTSHSRLKQFTKCGENYDLRMRDYKITSNGCWFIGIISKIQRVK
jgi:hypothetical protein